MLFQETPDTFNGIVLAVIRRIVGQFHGSPETVGKISNTVHELSSPAMVLWPIVLVDNKRRDFRKAFMVAGPKVRQAIDDEIAGHLGRGEVEVEFPLLGQIDAVWRHFGGFALEIMVESLDNYSIQTTSGEGADVDRRFGIQRYAQHRLILVSFQVNFVNFVKDRIGLGNLFQRMTFFTRFSP